MSRVLRSLLPAASTVALACGCDVAVAPAIAPLHGGFVDSPVANLAYGDGARTDSAGGFSYRPGARVQFRIGDIVLGTAPGARWLTPVELATAGIDETDPNALNLARFLQTVDEDRDPENGIRLPDGLHDAARGLSLGFATDPDTFEVDAGRVLDGLRGVLGGRRPLVPADAARAHLATTLRGRNSGVFRLRYEGDAVGAAVVAIARAGDVLGWARDDGARRADAVVGAAATDGSVVLEIVAKSTTLRGSIVARDLGGGWSGSRGRSGTFTGSRDDDTVPFLGADARAFAGTYRSATGASEVVVDADGDFEVGEPIARGTITALGVDGVARLAGASDAGETLSGTLDALGRLRLSVESADGAVTLELERSAGSARAR